MIKVCDAIMGTGKSSAAIRYINENPQNRYIYITPYLDEAARIKKGCPNANFVEPSDKIKEFGFRKHAHTMALIEEGRNIATTHQSFKRYTDETLEYIRQRDYVLIIDENVDVLEVFDFHEDDLKIAVDAGRIIELESEFVLSDDDSYKGKALAEMFELLKSRRLLKLTDEKDKRAFYWTLPAELITSFKEVFILTYMFEGQSLYYFLKIHNLSYESIGIARTDDGGYRFGDVGEYTPSYVPQLLEMIEVLEHDRLNSIGDEYYALSMTWYRRGGANVESMRKNLYNVFNNIWRDIPSSKKLWGSFNDARNKIKGKGYTNSFLNFNAKATNAYRERNCLAYPVNLFMNVGEKKFYEMNGVEVDEDAYALSIMVQWIWRSEIRDGEKIRLYLPSRRMRDLLFAWVKEVCKGGECDR